jgi:hypothetical protein
MESVGEHTRCSWAIAAHKAAVNGEHAINSLQLYRGSLIQSIKHSCLVIHMLADAHKSNKQYGNSRRCRVSPKWLEPTSHCLTLVMLPKEISGTGRCVEMWERWCPTHDQVNTNTWIISEFSFSTSFPNSMFRKGEVKITHKTDESRTWK